MSLRTIMIFPEFENMELIDNIRKKYDPLAKLGGVSKQEDIFGNYLFLDVLQGAEEVSCIHQILYDNEFKEFDRGLQYIPHMTIGKLPTAELLNDAYHAVKSMEATFCTIVEKVSVEMIGENEESVIVIEKELI